MRLLVGVILLSSVSAAALAQEAGRENVENFWKSKGVPAHVAAGIADNVARESGFDPTQIGDGGTSAGLYQMHNERFTRLLADMQNDSAWKDVIGRDPIAAAHWNEIVTAPTQKAAARLWSQWFERCAACGAKNPRAGIPQTKYAAVMPQPAAAPPGEIALHQWHDGSNKTTSVRPHEWHREQN